MPVVLRAVGISILSLSQLLHFTSRMSTHRPSLARGPERSLASERESLGAKYSYLHNFAKTCYVVMKCAMVMKVEMLDYDE